MVEINDIEVSESVSGRKRLGWLLTIFTRPAKTLQEITREERAAWLIPMLLLTVLTIASVLIAGPLKQQAALAAPAELPPGFEYMTPEQQEQYMQAQASASGTTQTFLFPAIGKLIALWLGWFILGGILHLALTLLGSRGTSTAAFNLAAWASVPFAIRIIVQIVAMLTARQLIQSPGLSGFIAADATGVMSFFRSLLTMVDIYLIWQIVLLWVGSSSSMGLTKGKALTGVLTAMLLLLAISALPSFLVAQFNGLSVDGPFFFF